MIYLNIILTINTIVLIIIAFGICFLVYHDIVASKTKYVRHDDDDDKNSWDCLDDEDDDCASNYHKNDGYQANEADLTPKTIKCSRQFGFNNG